LRGIHGVTIRDKVSSCQIRKTLNIKPFLRIRRSQLCWFGCVTRMSSERLARKFCWLRSSKSNP